MRVFVTGATGFVGTAVVRELVNAGYRVSGLARSAAAAGMLTAMGAEAHAGDLDDFESLRQGIQRADAVIHTAFNHDFSQFRESCEADRSVIGLFGDELAGSDRPLIITSAIGVLPKGGTVTEETDPVEGSAANPRSASEEAARRIVDRGGLVSVIRLAPSVHGEGDHAFVPTLIRLARETGVSAYEGEGRNLWPTVHRLDAARLYRLALEKGFAGARYHAVAEDGVAFRDIATAIGDGLSIPVVSKTLEEAAAHFDWFSHFARMDVRASNVWTCAQLGWEPGQPDLISDLKLGHYFNL
ncbi:SDR family oxidoreductase [Brucella sp. BE17]|uniref:SDR family oxidoreductase n=1 Tax=Brucella sp. BE17 TaxID=3142977 RepID=UPI0031BA9836